MSCNTVLCGRTVDIKSFEIKQLANDTWFFDMIVSNGGSEAMRVGLAWFGDRAAGNIIHAVVACEAGQKTFTFPLCEHSHTRSML